MSDTEITHLRQAHEISRSSYMMPASNRKLIFFAMAFCEIKDDKFQTVEVESNDILHALGMSRGGETYNLLKSITKETRGQVFTIENEDGYEHFTWLSQCQYVKSRDIFKFRLDDSLIQYVKDLKSHFSMIPLHAVGKLQGKYAIRLFELVLSNAGFEGKNGNKKGEWWYEDTIDMLRHRFEIQPNEYTRMTNFRTRVIDDPIKEINRSEIGIHITPEYIRKGKFLKAVRFNVKRVKTSDPRMVSPVTQTENEYEEIKRQHPDLFKKYLAEELQQDSFDFISEELKMGAAEDRAIQRIIKSTSKRKGKK